MSSQMDLFTGSGVESAEVPARPVWARPGPGEPPRFVRVTARQACGDCVAEQRRRHVKGLPPEGRLRAVVLLRSAEEERPLCSAHARERGWNPVAQSKVGAR